MKNRRGFGTLSDGVKSRLLGSARAAAGAERRVEPVVPPPSVRPSLAFKDLPEYNEFKIQKAAADFLGLENPFFRVHQACAGATTRIDGQECINFASYNYVGMNGHPEVAAAAKKAVDQYGVSASASRVVAGERDIHRMLERKIAEFIGVEDAVTFVSGHATNVALIGQLLRPDDLLIHDALIHNSVMVGAKLSGCVRRSFPHNDLKALEVMLAEASGRHERIMIAVEGHYSMDGDTPDLAALVALKNRFGVWLMVDEAHALGVLGETGRGVAEQQGVDPREINIWMGTLSKTLAGCGGYVAGDAALTDFLKLTAPGFVYSVGMPPPVAAAALAALEVLEREPERVARLNANAQLLQAKAEAAGLDTGSSEGHAIVPVMVGDSVRAVALADRLLKRGINVLPIIYPAVPERTARLRFFVTSEHTPEQIEAAVTATAEELEELTRANFGLKAAALVARVSRGNAAPGR